MSDPRTPEQGADAGETSVEDVVGSARDGLAQADQAAREAVGDAAPADDDASEHDAASEAASPEPVEAQPADADADDEPLFATPELNEAMAVGGTGHDEDAARDDSSVAAPAGARPDAAPDAEATRDADAASVPVEQASAEPEQVEPVAPAPEAEAATSVLPPADDEVTVPVAAAAPAASVPPVVVPAAAQPIFVQAPEEPRRHGNRAAAGGIGLIAAIAFAVLYLAVGVVQGLLDGSVTGDGVATRALDQAGTWGLWVPTIVFFLAFWVLGAMINRGRWGVWVILGLLVGLAAYAGQLLGVLFEAPFWAITASQGVDLVEKNLFAPLAVAAFVIGRELTVWFSAWVAARGKKMTALNIEERREYERTLEAGPQPQA